MEAALVACLYAAAPGGFPYGFSLYSESLRARLHLSDAQLLNIANIPNIVGLGGPVFGWLAQRLGPRRGVLLGGVVVTSSLVLQYLIARGILDFGHPLVPLIVVACITFAGNCVLASIAFTLPVLYYQRCRGQAMALVKCFVGLSGAAVAQFFWLAIGQEPGFRKSSPVALESILFWAYATALSCGVAWWLIPVQFSTDAEHESEGRLGALFWLCLSWGLCAAVLSVVTLNVLHGILAVGLLIAAVVPLFLLAFWTRVGPQSAPVVQLTRTLSLERRFETPVALDFKQMVGTVEAWCLFIASTGVIGSGFFLTTSMSEILSSAGYPSDDVNLLAQTLCSAGNMLGRLTCMIPSDAVVRRGIARPHCCVVILGMMMGAQGCFVALPHTRDLVGLVAGGALLTGYSFGAIWPHLVVICSELFGSRHLSANYMFFRGGTTCLGTYLFAQVIAANVYQARVGDGMCKGAQCFFLTHIICIGACLIGALCSVVMGLKSSSIYHTIHMSVRSLERSRGTPLVDAGMRERGPGGDGPALSEPPDGGESKSGDA